MVAAWKAAGFSYNRFLAIAARAVRRTLKEEPRLQADRRGRLDVKYAKWSNGKQGEPQALGKAPAS